MKILLKGHDVRANVTFVLDKESCTYYSGFLELLIFIKQEDKTLDSLYVKDQENTQGLHRDDLHFLNAVTQVPAWFFWERMPVKWKIPQEKTEKQNKNKPLSLIK